MSVDILDETGTVPSELASSAFETATVILEFLGRADSELCVMLVGDERMRELNRQWRGREATTDVLSFSQLEGGGVTGEVEFLGDIVVSLDVLRRQAAAGGWTEQEELTRLILHGVLHLLGHDHETKADALVMKAQEGRIVTYLAVRGLRCAWEGPEA